MDKKIIIAILAFFLVASAYLFYVSDMRSNVLKNQNQWILSFDNPKSNSLDFTIENLSEKNNFHWEIVINKETIEEGATNIMRGEKKVISPSIAKMNLVRISVIVSDGENKKEIYKNF